MLTLLGICCRTVGVECGDVVVIVSESAAETTCLVLGTLRLGAVACVLPHNFGRQEYPVIKTIREP